MRNCSVWDCGGFQEDFSFEVFDIAFIMLKFFLQHHIPGISDSTRRNNDMFFVYVAYLRICTIPYVWGKSA